MYILHHLSTCQKPCQEETTCSPYTNKTVLTEQSSTTGHAREPQSLFILRCKKTTTCRQDSWDFPGLASMASYWWTWQTWRKKGYKRTRKRTQHKNRNVLLGGNDISISIGKHKRTDGSDQRGGTDQCYANGTIATTCASMDSWGWTVTFNFTQKGAQSKASEYLQELKPEMLDSECLVTRRQE